MIFSISLSVIETSAEEDLYQTHDLADLKACVSISEEQ